MNIEHAYTKKILDAFEQISQVPRPSKKEEKIVAWLLEWAAENGLEARSDDALNIVIEVPASPGYENSQTLILQGHMDMVCEKSKGFEHDFDKDPIELVYTDDGWLTANQTTLGADNGIAIAMAMVAQAAFALYLVVDLPVIEPRYGLLARDFGLIEAGAMTQLLMEWAEGLGLGLCPIGGFDPQGLAGALELGDARFLALTLVGGVAA